MSTMIMTDKMKQYMGVLSFLPLLGFTISFIYFLNAILPLFIAQNAENHLAINSEILQHYDTMFKLLAISGVVGAIVLIYFLVHLARIRHMNEPTKLGWIIFLAVFVPIALPIFWYFEIRTEREELEVYHTIK